MSESSCVQVAVRVRPMLGSESGSTKCIETLQSSLDHQAATNVVRIGGSSGPTFVFDQAFDGRTPQEVVFQSKVAPLIERCLEGYNATVLAYGQTGSGKTHTIMGPSTALDDGESAGLIPRAVRTLFARLLQQKESANKYNKHDQRKQRRQQELSENDQPPPYDYEVRVQFLELYGEVIRDLLITAKPSNEKLTIRDIGNEEPEVLGATQLLVESAEEALLCLTRGMMRRVTAETAMNATSSRSHAILSVMVHQTSSSSSSSSSSVEGHTEIKRSKFSFVDLAGSERLKRTHALGQRMKEGVDINKGLLVLGNVISALGDETKRGKTFVPYRDSKLTRLLKGSLGGNHKTLMIACVSPSSLNFEETLNCLRYANRAKNIQNNAVVNVDAGSKILSELRSQVQNLASNLLCIKKGGDPDEMDTFTLEMLQKLSEGESCVSSTSNSNTSAPFEGLDSRSSHGGSQRAQEVEIELERTKRVLLQASEELALTRDELFETRVQRDKFKTYLTKYLTPEEQTLLESPDCEIPLASTGSVPHDFDKNLNNNDILLETKKELQATTEELFTVKAEKEMYRLRLNAGDPTDVETAFLERAASYEAEISSLKAALGSQRPVSSVVENAKSSNDQRSLLLSQLQSELLASISSEATAKITPGSLEFLRMHSRVVQSISPGEQLDAEEEAEEAELSAMTIKFLDEDKEQGSDFQRNEGESVSEEAAQRHRQLLEASLLELTHSIDEKENLIEQLQLSEEKYADMRSFYEEKLRQMEEQVREREKEREALLYELEERHASKSDTKDLQVRLKEKESHIFSLKKRQQELVGLTQVSSRNEAEINRLRHDVKSMKQKKVEMQNLMAQERKSHLGEIQSLKKKSMQLDREVNKWKKISENKAFEAERAHKVSKTHLEQVSQLRAKYKEAERNLRVRTVKRGVMEKAGLDPVLVGRRRITNQGDGSSKAKLGARVSPKLAEIDTDLILELLDRKVADVGRKEALADKLANEWEDHMELVSKKHLLLEEGKSNREVAEEELEAVDVQLKYKEARIRQLAQRLGNQTKMKEEREPETNFLGEEDYKALFRNVSPLAASQQTARVLFGMVVRERRRVAALARAASKLDEKALVAQKEAKEKDDAFRSFVEEERHQRAALAQEQQEQILSLMEMVKHHDASDAESSNPSDMLLARASSTSRVMLLANERNEALERQLLELQGEQETAEMYKAKATLCTESLAVKNEECVVLHQQLKALRSSLQQIHEMITTLHKVDKGINTSDLRTDGSVGDIDLAVLAVVKKALYPAVDILEKNSNEEPKSDSYQMFASRNRHVELTNASDSENDEEIPDWAGDIMADLAVIADGEIPQVLLNSPSFIDVCQQPKWKSSGSVFDRLTNPENFTGVQKQRTARSNVSQKARQERRDVARKITEDLEKLEKTVGLDLKAPPKSDAVGATKENPSGEEDLKTNGNLTERLSVTLEKVEQRSVFDRLLSPSAYTGTQKDRSQRTQKMNFQDDDDADQLLDEILSENTEIVVDENERDLALQVADKIAEYTQQNVFERLQTTTTQAYAGKHGRQSPAAHRFQSSSPVRIRSDGDLIPHAANDPSDHTNHNVFKRLQKTETQASAQKKNSAPQPTSSKPELGKQIGFGRNESEDQINTIDTFECIERDYVEPNVFERLQRTTTQSFAGKHGINIDEKNEN